LLHTTQIMLKERDFKKNITMFIVIKDDLTFSHKIHL
jgi:hypothetical protein